MRLPKQDLIATALVAAAGVFYILWLTGVASAGMSSTRTTALVVLALGFAASASAVVPHFDQLIHGNKAYLAVTSLIGLVALIAGVQALARGERRRPGRLDGRHERALADGHDPPPPSGPQRRTSVTEPDAGSSEARTAGSRRLLTDPR